jgi:hypothetical protein
MERIGSWLTLTVLVVAVCASSAHSELTGMPGSNLSGVNLQALGLAGLSTYSFQTDRGPQAPLVTNPTELAIFLGLNRSEAVFNQTSSSPGGSAGFAFQAASTGSGAVNPGLAPTTRSSASVVTQNGNTVPLTGAVSNNATFHFAQAPPDTASGPRTDLSPQTPILASPTSYTPFSHWAVWDTMGSPTEGSPASAGSPVLQTASANAAALPGPPAPLVGPVVLSGGGVGIFSPLIPEPSSLCLLAMGALVLASYGKRRNQRRAGEPAPTR